MFRKEKDFVERSRSLLKTKEVKALKRAILQQLPSLNEETLQEILPSKGDITAIKLADRTLLYSYEGGVLFFDVQGRNQLFPTVLALTKAPNMLRTFITHGPVSRFVLRGADFMVPGVFNREELRGLKKNEKCCIKIFGNPLPFAVGESGLDFEDLQMVTHGKALVVLHSFGDLLVSVALPAIPLPGFTKEEIMPIEGGVIAAAVEESSENNIDGGEVNGNAEKMTEERNEGQTVLTEQADAEQQEEQLEEQQEEEQQDAEQQTMLLAAEIIDRQEADDRLQRAIALCIRYAIKDKQLPILLSSFWSIVLRCLIAENQTTELTNSTFRRPAELFAHCQSIGLLQCHDDNSNGVISIISINRTHELLRVHKHRDPEKLKALLSKADSAAHNAMQGDSKHNNKKSSLQVIDIYKLPKKFRDIFGQDVGGDLGLSFLRAREIRQVVQTYASERALERPNGMLLIPVEDPLLDVVADMGEAIVDNNQPVVKTQQPQQDTADEQADEDEEKEDEHTEEVQPVISKDMYSMMDNFYLNPSSQQTGLKIKSTAEDGDFPPLPPPASNPSAKAAGQQKVKFHKAVELPPAKPAAATAVKAKASAMKQSPSSSASAPVDSSNKKRVSIAGSSSAPSPFTTAAAPTAISISIEKCCLAIQSHLTRYHVILPNGDVSQAIIKSGPIPKVKVLSEKRAGNKMVTIVRGLDPFGIDLAQLAKACQKKFACSVAVGAVPGIAQQRELVIQGSASMELEGFLIEEYGLPRGVIDITIPKASGKKK